MVWIGAKIKEVLTSGYCIKEVGIGLVITVSVSLIQNFNGAGTRGSIADTTRLFAAIERFNTIGPHQVEDGVIFVNLNRGTKHALYILLVKLKEFRLLPVVLVILLQEFSLCETHHAWDVLTNIAQRHNVVCPSLEDLQTLLKKVCMIVELVVCKLREVTRRHDG